MNPFSLVYPMFAMVLLTAFVLASLFRSRVGAVRAGHVSVAYYKVYQGAPEPEGAARLARHFINLFEAPTLFYVGCLAAMVTHAAGTLALLLAWAYVAARVAHSIIHLGKNRLRPRIAAYFMSWLALLALWIDIAIEVARRA